MSRAVSIRFGDTGAGERPADHTGQPADDGAERGHEHNKRHVEPGGEDAAPWIRESC